MMHWGNGMGMWGMTLMILSVLLPWALIIAGTVALVRNLGRRSPSTCSEQATAPWLLADRFARGEMDEQEYAHRLRVIADAAPTSRVDG